MKRKIISGVVVLLTLGLLVASIPPAKAQFVIASWEYPDEHNQGIDSFTIYENSTGDWLIVGGFGPNLSPEDSGIFDWAFGVSIKLKCHTWFNNTLVGAENMEDGKLFHRHNVTVTNFVGTLIFSQQNFTYFNSDIVTEDPLWYYEYTVILNFIPVSGAVYTTTVIYEVFF